MKLLFFSGLLFIIVGGMHANGQVKDAKANVKQQAAQMSALLLKGDTKGYVNYLSPVMCDAGGGKEDVAGVLDVVIAQMKKKHVAYGSISYDMPQRLTKKGNEWQTTINQHIVLVRANGRTTFSNAVAASSADEGKTWKFMDKNILDANTVHELFPEASPLPPREPEKGANLKSETPPPPPGKPGSPD